MLDKSQEAYTSTVDERRPIGDYLLTVAFLSQAGTSMIVWIAAIGWAGWRLITWLF